MIDVVLNQDPSCRSAPLEPQVTTRACRVLELQLDRVQLAHPAPTPVAGREMPGTRAVGSSDAKVTILTL